MAVTSGPADVSGLLERISRLEADRVLLLAVAVATDELLAAADDLRRRQGWETIPGWAPGLPAAMRRVEAAVQAVRQAVEACRAAGIRR